MGIASLITWLLTAAGGFVMLGIWLSRGGMRQEQTGGTRVPAPVIFGHFGLAAIGLVLWIIYVFTDSNGLAWRAFVLLVPVAALGFFMLARWLPTYRSRTLPTTAGPTTGGPATGGPATAGGPGTASAGDLLPAERHFPVAVVAAHGLLAVVTVVLVLLAALEVGE